jgi:hypothetical protein
MTGGTGRAVAVVRVTEVRAVDDMLVELLEVSRTDVPDRVLAVVHTAEEACAALRTWLQHLASSAGAKRE